MTISVFTDIRTINSNATLTVSPTGLAVGDIVVVAAFAEDSPRTLSAPVATGITFTQQVRDTTSGHCFVMIHTGVVTTAGSTTITSTVTATGAVLESMVAVVFPAADGYHLATTPNVVDTRSTGAPSGSATCTVGSILVNISADWNAINPGTPTYVGSSTRIGEAWTTGRAAAYFWYSTATTNPTTIGVSSPTGQTYTIASVEVLKTAPSTPQFEGWGIAA